jgi:hypothetical protein
MRMFQARLTTWWTASILIVAIATPAGSALARDDSFRPKLSDDFLQLLERLEGAEEPDPAFGFESVPEPDPDPLAPVNVLLAASEQLEKLRRAYPRRSLEAGLLADAMREVETARRVLGAGSTGNKMSNLDKALRGIKKTQTVLERIATQTEVPLGGLQDELSGLAARTAEGVLRVARRAGSPSQVLAVAEERYDMGLRAAGEGRYVVAAALLGGSLSLAGNTIQFDVELFEQNILNAMTGQAVGWAYSIAFGGQIESSGAFGSARTAADPPATAQSANKQMHVVSISKMLSTIVILRQLEELGLGPDETFAQYLPSDWTIDPGVELLTFRDLMTHRTGFGQQGFGCGSGNPYASLRTYAASPLPFSRSFSYCNSNFGMLRVLAAGLNGIDPADFPEFSADQLTAAAFIIEAQSLYGSIGVSTDCAPSDPTQTAQYTFPDSGNPGFIEPDRSLACGGIGFFISANDLVGVMTTLRNTQELMFTETRREMEDGSLGFMSPANYAFPNGAFGVYYAHGGDWVLGGGETHTCVMAFPIAVEASLLLNSRRGAIPYQCAVLQQAFDNAWVSP